MAISTRSIVQRHRDVLDTAVGGEVVAMSLTTGKSFAMDPRGSRIWQLLQQPLGFDELTRQLARDYAVADDVQFRADVQAFLEDLVANQLAVASEAPAPGSTRP